MSSTTAKPNIFSKFNFKSLITALRLSSDYIGSLFVTILMILVSAVAIIGSVGQYPVLAISGIMVLSLIFMILYLLYIAYLNRRPVNTIDDVMAQLAEMEEQIDILGKKL